MAAYAAQIAQRLHPDVLKRRISVRFSLAGSGLLVCICVCESFCVGCERRALACSRDGMGWEGLGWDGMGWDKCVRDGMGWERTDIGVRELLI